MKSKSLADVVTDYAEPLGVETEVAADYAELFGLEIQLFTILYLFALGVEHGNGDHIHYFRNGAAHLQDMYRFFQSVEDGADHFKFAHFLHQLVGNIG